MSSSTLTIQRSRAGLVARLADYVELSKPRIAVMVLIAVAVSYCLSVWGQPNPWVLIHVLLGTLLVASSASALNQWMERGRDAMMERTADRPLPAGRLTARETLVFAGITILAGTCYLGLTVSWQTALWSLLSWALYAWVYTPLKSRTSWNTAVGAVAGAMPVLIGWSAGNPVDLRAGSLFLLLFLWQFPHFMAIAWIYRQQYATAGMRMLTVVDPSGRWAGVQAVSAALVLIPVSLVPVLSVPGMGGFSYGIVATVLGLGQFACAVAFWATQREQSARHLLRASLVYLPVTLLGLVLVPWM